MSDKDQARRATAQISFQGSDITGDILPYFLSMTYTDNEDGETDDFQLKLQDRDQIWMTKWLKSMIDAAARSNPLSQDTGVICTVSNKEGTTVREGANSKDKKLTSLKYGATISVVRTSGDYSAYYYSATKYGWVLTKDVSAKIGTVTYPTLKKGDKNASVRLMQQYLVHLGYHLDRYGVDGSFGAETEKALKKFQQDKGLSSSGVCDALTWQAIMQAVNPVTVKDYTGFGIQAVIARENWYGDGKDEILDTGFFELDTVDASGPPNTISIKGTSLPFASSVRQTEKSRAWEKYDLRKIAEEISGKNGMACMFLSSVNPTYTRREQYRESDIAFLTRLCHESYLSLKVTNNIIVIFDQNEFETKPTTVTIDHNTVTWLKYKMQVSKNDTQYNLCRVSYTTPAGKKIEGHAYAEDYNADSEDNQCLEIHEKVESIAEANALAAARLKEHNKYAMTASFTMPGDPNLVAGVTVQLKSWGSFDGKYIISQAKHTIDDSGYKTQISIRRVYNVIVSTTFDTEPEPAKPSSSESKKPQTKTETKTTPSAVEVVTKVVPTLVETATKVASLITGISIPSSPVKEMATKLVARIPVAGATSTTNTLKGGGGGKNVNLVR